MNTSTKTIANDIIQHYKKRGYSTTQACQFGVIDMDLVCNHKTLYHISRGQKPGDRIYWKMRKLHGQLFPLDS